MVTLGPSQPLPLYWGTLLPVCHSDWDASRFMYETISRVDTQEAITLQCSGITGERVCGHGTLALLGPLSKGKREHMYVYIYVYICNIYHIFIYKDIYNVYMYIFFSFSKEEREGRLGG